MHPEKDVLRYASRGRAPAVIFDYSPLTLTLPTGTNSYDANIAHSAVFLLQQGWWSKCLVAMQTTAIMTRASPCG